MDAYVSDVQESRRAGARWGRAMLLAISASVAMLGSTHATAQAADFPNKPMRMIVPLGPGGLGDIVARTVAEHTGQLLGQPVVVENRPGAGGTVGSGEVAKAAPDGYTLLLGSIGTIGIAPGLYRSLPYDSDTAFAPITLAAGGQFFFVVHPSLPATSMSAFLAHARANPGKLNYGSQGSGSTLHLAMEQLMSSTRISMVHVPYKSAPALATALLSGEVPVAITDLPSVLPLVRSGQLRALAVTSDKRASVVPDVPTLAEGGVKDVRFISWVGFLTSAGTSPAIVNKLNGAMVAALKLPSTQQIFNNIGASEIFATSPEEFAAFIKRERAQWGAVIKATGVKAD